MWAGWVHHSWTFWHAEAIREVGPEMPERGLKTSTVPVVWANLEFFRRDPMISCRDWWPWTKPGYITMTRRKSNNQWSGGIPAYPSPPLQNSEWKNPLEKLIKTASSSLIIFQRAKLSTRSITHLWWCNWRTFWRKPSGVRSPNGGPVLARQCPGSPGTCNPEESGLPRLPVFWSPTHPILRIWPRRTTPCSLDWRNKWKVAIFLPTRRSLLPRRPGWTDNLLNFLSGLQRLAQRAKKCIELRGGVI